MINTAKKSFWMGILGVNVFWVGCTRHISTSAEPVQENKIPVRVETVHRGRIQETLRWSAVTAPKMEVALTFKGSGRIRKLLFEEGTFVRKGQLLGQLVEEDYWSYAQLARVQVRTLEPDAKRLENLADVDAVPRAEAERMRGQANVARAQLRQAEAALSGVLLTAPIDGVIEKKSVSEGDLVSPAREVAKLVDLSQLWIHLAASEQELAFLHPGTRINLRFFNPEQEIDGIVERISPMADFKTRTFSVSVRVKNEMTSKGQWKLRAGMRVTATLVRYIENCLTVPFSAVLQDEEGHTRVCLAQEGRAKCIPVKTGRLLQGRIEILDGMLDGQAVIVSGQQYLRDASKIHILQ